MFIASICLSPDQEYVGSVELVRLLVFLVDSTSCLATMITVYCMVGLHINVMYGTTS